MFKANSLIILVVVAVVVIGGYLVFSGGLPQREEQQQEGPTGQELLSIAGRVTSVNTSANSFVLLSAYGRSPEGGQPKEERSFTVQLGKDTEFIRLVFPFDISNPPADATFTPEREVVTIEDLEVNDQVFVRSQAVIKTGQDIVNPLEIQILP